MIVWINGAFGAGKSTTAGWSPNGWKCLAGDHSGVVGAAPVLAAAQ
jgi:hypothetical protein